MNVKKNLSAIFYVLLAVSATQVDNPKSEITSSRISVIDRCPFLIFEAENWSKAMKKNNAFFKQYRPSKPRGAIKFYSLRGLTTHKSRIHRKNETNIHTKVQRAWRLQQFGFE